ncbi:hypothetical protein KUL42_17960 [Alteromonas sp. KUL42]|uniref:hypothetical protein n=1 Tax=Alteromonas sp. KUL42 TaxID=2480797 RepID=UPI001035A1FA|nr:hypothetical protein [Alteromonas sp. KUL42]TAP35560.1 hypothetical protein EYR97_08855 [Alteromonas sp. KUL42]GEA07035.1 hypothetical protein KUL42_17960 [Alteromonas sp. KUL42]
MNKQFVIFLSLFIIVAYTFWGADRPFAEARVEGILHEKLPESPTVTLASEAVYNPLNSGGSLEFKTSDSNNPRDKASYEFADINADYWIVVGDNMQSMRIKRIDKSVPYASWPYSNNFAVLYGSGDVAKQFNEKFPIGTILTLKAETNT